MAEAAAGTWAPPDERKQKCPVPSEDAQRNAAQLLAEVFEPGSRNDPGQKLELSKKLLSLAKGFSSASERFVTLLKAMELAGEGGDAALMLQTVDAIGAEYDVDVLHGKQRALEVFADGPSDPKRTEAVIENTKALVDEAVAQRRYELALRAADTAYALCLKPQAKQYRKEVYDLRKALKDWVRRQQELEAAQKALKTDADNPVANLTVGRWYCLVQGDWKQGLPYLAKGRDEQLKRMAEQDLAVDEEDVGQIMACADAWWDLGQKKSGQARNAVLLRSGHWYQRARTRELEGLQQLKVEKRLEEIAKIPASDESAPGTGMPGSIAKSESAPGEPAKAIAGGRRLVRPAQVEVFRLDPEMLVITPSEDDPIGHKWKEFPDWLKGAVIYSKPEGGGPGAVADIRVRRGGVIYLSCFYGYGGNPSGGWQKERLTQKQMVEQGWEVVGEMVRNNHRKFVIFRKIVESGTRMQIRCAKYLPPLVILVKGPGPAPVRESGRKD